ncbi:MAG: hypothetical protein DRJ51_02225 [Thermoprotei archaeon]|nr:MAG: hypothetical protein DRJ51_02225 [Thermoprotei archaeon]
MEKRRKGQSRNLSGRCPKLRGLRYRICKATPNVFLVDYVPPEAIIKVIEVSQESVKFLIEKII